MIQDKFNKHIASPEIIRVSFIQLLSTNVWQLLSLPAFPGTRCRHATPSGPLAARPWAPKPTRSGSGWPGSGWG
ncbi:MAG: hypothetical protein MUO76_20085, partial [Anaerolineaceae bacterium]|nr:hypothetical protein [Anaerolineaceae bacterium]